MRPVSIELEGFFAYRQRAIVDLSDIEYFSLEGPTGSGKSSLIDAMIFALYGRIPRLGGNTVGPAISAGTDRARVCFKFLLGEVPYTATRQLERTPTGGARATEVRLESGDLVIASGGADVTPEVSRLLNLSYEDFTRTVVLPQGDFARFLTATPQQRQELLRGLLGLDVYRTMGSLARNREQLARSELQSAANRLEELQVPTADEQQAALDRLAEIIELSDRIERDELTLDALAEKLRDLTEKLEAITGALERLERFAVPPNLDELSGLLTKASVETDSQTEQLRELEKEHLSAVEALSARPDAGTLERFKKLYARLSGIESDLADIDIDGNRNRLERAEADVVRAREGLQQARVARDEAMAAHAAHDLSRRLEAGERCPVCLRIVDDPPEGVSPVDLDAIDSEAEAAAAALEAGREMVSSLARDLAREESTHNQLVLNQKDLIRDLGEAPASADISDLLRQVEESSMTVATLESQIRVVKKLLADAEDQQSRLAEQQRSLGRTLMVEREKIADLKPPIAESEDVLIQWKELLAWREKRTSEIVAIGAGLREEIQVARVDLDAATKVLHDRLDALGIEAGKSLSVAVARAEEQAKQTVKENSSLVEQARRLGEDISSAEKRIAVSESLARHLRADGFERWMMVGAIGDLVAGANSILSDLSQSSYSLHSDEEGSFEIVDHRNADEIRPVSTLSGGETFLVSLALALSLAETLAAGSGSKLDAIILDEGFGTLDDESLDVVASVLESLTISGLMVGIITHVKALASRAPVRFVVQKGPDGSRVEAVA